MSSPLLHDSVGTGSDHSNRKRRPFLEHVDLEKTNQSLKADGEISLRRGKRAMINSQEETQIHLRLGKELLPRQPDVALLRLESQPAFTSTLLYRQEDITQKPVDANTSSLPPSSPLAFSSDGNDAVGLLEEDDIEADPFGFLAAEKKLKDWKPRFPSIPSYSESLLQEYGSSGEEDVSAKAFASQSSTLNKHLVFTASVEQERTGTPPSPSATLFANRSNEPSSPCRKAVKRRLRIRKAVREVEKRKNKDRIDEPSESKFTALDETFPPKHSKRNVQENGRTNRKVHGTSGKRAPRQSTKDRNTRTEILSHLNDEERKKFEREREERMAYYRRLDTYCVAKENVWVV